MNIVSRLHRLADRFSEASGCLGVIVSYRDRTIRCLHKTVTLEAGEDMTDMQLRAIHWR